MVSLRPCRAGRGRGGTRGPPRWGCRSAGTAPENRRSLRRRAGDSALVLGVPLLLEAEQQVLVQLHPDVVVGVGEGTGERRDVTAPDPLQRVLQPPDVGVEPAE